MEASTAPFTLMHYTVIRHDVPGKDMLMIWVEFAEGVPLQTFCVTSDAQMSRQEAGGRSEAASQFSAAKNSEEADHFSALFPLKPTLHLPVLTCQE